MINHYLTIDGGNTQTKYGLFNRDGGLVRVNQGDCSSLIESFKLTPENTLCALVNVAPREQQLEGFRVFNVADHFIDGRFLDMPVDYAATLGLDRLVLAYHAFDSKTSTALVDSGTFTTVDLVDAGGFKGGHILPGLGFLIESYNSGFNLKSLRPSAPLEAEIALPKNSNDAMASGLSHSFCDPVLGVLGQIDFDSLCLTGGNGKFLFNYLEKRPEMRSFQRSASILFDSHLVHKGLLKFLLRVAEAK